MDYIKIDGTMLRVEMEIKPKPRKSSARPLSSIHTSDKKRGKNITPEPAEFEMLPPECWVSPDASDASEQSIHEQPSVTTRQVCRL